MGRDKFDWSNSDQSRPILGNGLSARSDTVWGRAAQESPAARFVAGKNGLLGGFKGCTECTPRRKREERNPKRIHQPSTTAAYFRKKEEKNDEADFRFLKQIPPQKSKQWNTCMHSMRN